MSDPEAAEWSSIVPPCDLPELAVTPTRSQIFMFSAITWNRHHVHYDKEAALSEGLPDVVVQRGLLGNFIARMLGNWLGEAGEIEQLNWKVTNSARPDQELIISGKVMTKSSDADRHRVQCTVEIRTSEGSSVASGEARLQIF